MMVKKQIMLLLIFGLVSVAAYAGEQKASRINRYLYNGGTTIDNLKLYEVLFWRESRYRRIYENVSVVEQFENGEFSRAIPLLDISYYSLRSCLEELDCNGNLRPGKDALSNSTYYPSKLHTPPYKFRDFEFIQSLRKGTGVLCTECCKNTIVFNAQGNPQEVCDALKRDRITKKFQSYEGAC